MKSQITIAAVLSALLVVGYGWWFQVGPVWLAGYLGVSVVALVTVPIAYRLFGYLRDDRVKLLRKKELLQHQEMLGRLSELAHQLDSLGVIEASKQASRLTEMLNDFHEVIANRFRDSQITSSSYMDVARRVQRLVMQNLSDMVAVARSVASIDKSDTQDSKAVTGTDGQDQLQRRLDLASDQQARLDELTQDNRALLTALTETSVEVANIQELDEFERTEALARLRQLAGRAKQYGAN